MIATPQRAPKRHSPRIAAASTKEENVHLLKQVLRRKPYARSSPAYTAIAWNEVRDDVYGTRGEGADVKERYECLYAAWRNDSGGRSKVDAATLTLLETIQRDLAACERVEQAAQQAAQQPSTPRAAPATAAPGDSAASPQQAGQARTAPPSPSPPPATSPTTPPTAPPVTPPQAKRRAKRTTQTSDDQPRVKRPRQQRKTSTRTRASAGSPTPEEAPTSASAEEAPSVDASPASPSGQRALPGGPEAQSYRSDLTKIADNCLAIGERESASQLEAIMAVIQSQRERQQYAARAVIELAGRY